MSFQNENIYIGNTLTEYKDFDNLTLNVSTSKNASIYSNISTKNLSLDLKANIGNVKGKINARVGDVCLTGLVKIGNICSNTDIHVGNVNLRGKLCVGHVSVNSNVHVKSVKLNGNVTVGDVTVGSSTKPAKLSVGNVSVNSDVSVKSVLVGGNVSIGPVTVGSPTKATSLTVGDVTVHSNVTVGNVTANGKITVGNILLNGDVTVGNITATGLVSIGDVSLPTVNLKSLNAGLNIENGASVELINTSELSVALSDQSNFNYDFRSSTGGYLNLLASKAAQAHLFYKDQTDASYVNAAPGAILIREVDESGVIYNYLTLKV